MKNIKLAIGIILLAAITVAIFLFFAFKSKKTKVVFQYEEKTTQNIASENEAEEEMTVIENNATDNISNKETVDKPENETAEKNTSKEKEEQSEIKIKNNLVSWGFESSSNRKIDTIIIHSSYNALGGDEYDFKKLLQEYKDYGVSPHYVIDRKGNIYKLVAEKNIAYHAGESRVPDGRTGVNNFSIGIEIMTTKSDSPSSAQYASLKKLIADIKDRYKIKYTLGHNQIASSRKTDPWNFNWDKI